MGAAVAKVETGFKPIPKVELVEDRLKVSFEDGIYENGLKEAGIEVDLDKLKKFNDQFMKDVVIASGDALVVGYKEHKTAVGYDMELNTKLFDLTGRGNKITHSALSNTDSTGFGMAATITVRGMKATIAAKRKEIYNSFDL